MVRVLFLKDGIGKKNIECLPQAFSKFLIRYGWNLLLTQLQSLLTVAPVQFLLVYNLPFADIQTFKGHDSPHSIIYKSKAEHVKPGFCLEHFLRYVRHIFLHVIEIFLLRGDGDFRTHGIVP